MMRSDQRRSFRIRLYMHPPPPLPMGPGTGLQAAKHDASLRTGKADCSSSRSLPHPLDPPVSSVRQKQWILIKRVTAFRRPGFCNSFMPPLSGPSEPRAASQLRLGPFSICPSPALPTKRLRMLPAVGAAGRCCGNAVCIAPQAKPTPVVAVTPGCSRFLYPFRSGAPIRRWTLLATIADVCLDAAGMCTCECLYITSLLPAHACPPLKRCYCVPKSVLHGPLLKQTNALHSRKQTTSAFTAPHLS